METQKQYEGQLIESLMQIVDSVKEQANQPPTPSENENQNGHAN